jgi:hypothetical protein
VFPIFSWIAKCGEKNEKGGDRVRIGLLDQGVTVFGDASAQEECNKQPHGPIPHQSMLQHRSTVSSMEQKSGASSGQVSRKGEQEAQKSVKALIPSHLCLGERFLREPHLSIT